jgi:hypothetical protein
VSRRPHPARYAITSDGTLLLNVARFAGVRDLTAALEQARKEPGGVFIGVPAKPDEMKDAQRAMHRGLLEAADKAIAREQARRSGT